MRNFWIWILLLTLAPVGAENKIDFWNHPRTGANGFLTHPTEAWFKAAHEAGIEWVRLSPSNWKGEGRDFLIGNADHYRGIPEGDLGQLRQALDWAQRYQVKVVLVPLSLPGTRYRQHNDFRYDDRIWKEPRFQQQATDFWRDLARELNGHPAVVGYNVLNEPVPEMGTWLKEEGETPESYRRWYAEHRGGLRDLPAFYNRVISAIREVDPETPVMVDSGWYAQPLAFTHWEPLRDDKVLYGFHYYQPFPFTSNKNFREKKGWSYPGRVEGADWNRDRIEQTLEPLWSWADRVGVPRGRLVAAEFGCFRRNPGCASYFRDLLWVFEAQGVHWAFYSFREDGWSGMDYEVGEGPLGQAYWEAAERGEFPVPPRRDNPIWKVLRGALER